MRERPVARPVLGWQLDGESLREPVAGQHLPGGAALVIMQAASAVPGPPRCYPRSGVLCFHSKADGSLDGICQERSHERCDIEAGIKENMQNMWLRLRENIQTCDMSRLGERMTRSEGARVAMLGMCVREG